MASEHPDRFGRFALLSILGEGGMGRVYRARIEGPGGFRKDLALKVLRAEPDRDPERLAAALAKEARIGALLRHANLVDLYDFGVLDGQPWFSMGLVPGRSLDKIAADVGPMEPTRAVSLLAQTALGLAAIHELEIDGQSAGLVHRDLKPANVLVTPDDHVKLADFGISRGQHALTATATESLRGTPAYMSPEQARSAELDARSDLFALGLIGFELVTGSRFLRGGSIFEVMFSLLQVEQRLDDVRAIDAQVPGLGTLLADCLREDPDDRPNSARVVRDRLQALDPRSGAASRADWATTTLNAAAVDAPTIARGALGNLRPAPDTFVGRDRELLALREALQTPGRVVSLLGPGGTGKTRLAQELGLGIREDYPGGAWFIDLTEARSLDGICAAVAHTLDIPLGHGGGKPAERVGAALAGRGPTLFLFDNFEQVQRFAADTVGAWAGLCPHSRFVVTTRQRLALGSEHVVRVGPLRAPLLAPQTTEQLASVPAVQLFVDRARRSRPDFELSDDNAMSIAALLRSLDGIPLAIELAAARVRVLSVERLLERLPQRFDLLSTGRTDVTGRQATLRATIDWSWTLLEPWEQAGLAQASVFRGGFTLEAAEAVLDLSGTPGAPWVLDVVQALEDKSLLHSVTAPSGEIRFLHYESIREFAAEKLGDDTEQAVLRHIAWFSKRGTPESIEALSRKGGTTRRKRLTEDLENLWLAAERAVEQGLPEEAADATLAAADLLAFSGPLPIPLRMLTTVLDTPGLSERQRIRLLLARGFVYSLLSEEALAEPDLNRAEEMAHAAQEPLLEGIAWAEQGRLYLGGSNPQQRELLERARARFVELGDVRREGWILCSLAVRDSIEGRFQEARAGNEEALLKLKRSGDQLTSLVALGNLAVSYKDLGMNMLQLATLNEALRLSRELGARRFEAIVLVNLGVYQHYLGQLRRAEETYRKARALALEIGFKAVEGNALGNIGDVLKDQGRLGEAEGWLRQALEYTTGSGDVNHHVGQLTELAEILLGLGRLDEAEEAIAEAQELAPTMGNPRHVGQASVCRAWLLRLRGEHEAAVQQLDAADAVMQDLAETRFYLAGRLERAELAHTRGDHERARQIAIEADEGVRDVQDPLLLGALLSVRGRAERAVGDRQAWAATASELADTLDGIELAPESELRQALSALRAP